MTESSDDHAPKTRADANAYTRYVTWSQIRALLRQALELGDVMVKASGYDAYRTHSQGGVDTDRRCTYWGALVAIEALPAPLQRVIWDDVGEPCRKHHRATKYGAGRHYDGPHWHGRRAPDPVTQQIVDALT